MDPSAPSLALRIKSIPDAIRKANDYMRSCAPCASEILDMEAIIIQNLRLDEYAKVIGEWMKTITTEEDNETDMAKRISSRNVFDKAGNAARDEALVML